MSDAPASDLLEFDEPPRAGVVPDEGATETIARALKEAGLDVPCSLYNEALGLAREGHLGQAQARLQMLLCLDPDDADALLLLSKVHAAQGRPSEALARLDAAVSAGAMGPPGFRDCLESAIRTERMQDEERRARVVAREQGELKALRSETRQLRSDNVRLETEVTDSVGRERLWRHVAMGVSVLGSVLALLLAFSHRPVEIAELPAPAPEVAAIPAPIETVVTPPADEAPAPAPVAEQGPRTHVVASGDTLYKLAKRYYGNAGAWERIRAANADKLGGSIDLKLGTRLVIPW
jgi:LysM repeat protein